MSEQKRKNFSIATTRSRLNRYAGQDRKRDCPGIRGVSDPGRSVEEKRGSFTHDPRWNLNFSLFFQK